MYGVGVRIIERLASTHCTGAARSIIVPERPAVNATFCRRRRCFYLAAAIAQEDRVADRGNEDAIRVTR